MPQLNLRLDDRRLRALRRYATRRRTPVTWLIRDYIDHLIAGGDPVAVEMPAASELAQIAQDGGAFDWLSREPDLYSDKDGEPV